MTEQQPFQENKAADKIASEAARGLSSYLVDHGVLSIADIDLTETFKDRFLEAIRSASGQEESEEERLFGELMALMNGDGGHYQSEHGSKAASDRAVAKWEERYRRMDKAEFALASGQEEVEKLRAKIDYWRKSMPEHPKWDWMKDEMLAALSPVTEEPEEKNL